MALTPLQLERLDESSCVRVRPDTCAHPKFRCVLARALRGRHPACTTGNPPRRIRPGALMSRSSLLEIWLFLPSSAPRGMNLRGDMPVPIPNERTPLCVTSARPFVVVHPRRLHFAQLSRYSPRGRNGTTRKSPGRSQRGLAIRGPLEREGGRPTPQGPGVSRLSRSVSLGQHRPPANERRKCHRLRGADVRSSVSSETDTTSPASRILGA
jgi:hypothetical protein